MPIAIRMIESNARRDDTVVNNGIAIDLDLQPVSGTEKQVAWAHKIRTKMVGEFLGAMVRAMPAAQRTMMSVAEHDALLAEANRRSAQIEALVAKADTARFWIDLRDTPVRDIFRRLAAEHGRPA